jgi:hypothetical protein
MRAGLRVSTGVYIHLHHDPYQASYVLILKGVHDAFTSGRWHFYDIRTRPICDIVRTRLKGRTDESHAGQLGL